jgi:hypothetical protein
VAAAGLSALQPDARTAVVLLTHDPKIDDPALLAVLPTGRSTSARWVPHARTPAPGAGWRGGCQRVRSAPHPWAGRTGHRRADAGGDRAVGACADDATAARSRLMRFGPVPVPRRSAALRTACG